MRLTTNAAKRRADWARDRIRLTNSYRLIHTPQSGRFTGPFTPYIDLWLSSSVDAAIPNPPSTKLPTRCYGWGGGCASTTLGLITCEVAISQSLRNRFKVAANSVATVLVAMFMQHWANYARSWLRKALSRSQYQRGQLLTSCSGTTSTCEMCTVCGLGRGAAACTWLGSCSNAHSVVALSILLGYVLKMYVAFSPMRWSELKPFRMRQQ